MNWFIMIMCFIGFLSQLLEAVMDPHSDIHFWCYKGLLMYVFAHAGYIVAGTV